MKKNNFFKFKVMILLVLALLLPTQNVFAAATSVKVVKVQQSYSNWCWAACCESVFRGTFGVNISQKDVVRHIMGPYLPNAGGSEWQIQKVFNDYGYSSNILIDSLSFARVKEEIKAGRPIIANLAWRDSTVGHTVVITAYDTRDYTNYIWYMDPATGYEYMQSFYEFATGFKYHDQTVYWRTSVYGFKKK